MVLLSEALHDRAESLNLSLECSYAWFVYFSIVGGHHRASKYHATLRLGSDNMVVVRVPIDGSN